MSYEVPEDGSFPSWARQLVTAANQRNVARNSPSARLSEEDFRRLWTDCDGRCAMSGLRFSSEQIGSGRARRPFAPSLDRIDPSKPYQLDNVRIVTAIANFAMNAWGDQPLKRLCAAVFQKHGTPAHNPAPEAELDAGDVLLDGDLSEPDLNIKPFPPRADLREAIRGVLQGGPKHADDLARILAERFDVPLQAQRAKLANNKVPAWRNHVAWALVELGVNRRGTGEIERGGNGYRLRAVAEADQPFPANALNVISV